ncbi:helix-turn-helix domain-containing protein [Ruegeria sp. ANG-S4]|uniref:helix-turn-helix domain-containing protein n=1 Tax=Ruegeria sp. ANG-S4 TaxID=1577904 RepID=UPI00057D0387
MLSEENERKYKLRVELGEILRRNREAAGLTQLQLSRAIGLPGSRIVTHYERAKSPIPPRKWRPIAKALGMKPFPWVMKCAAAYCPDIYVQLFLNTDPSEASRLLNGLHASND